MMVRLLYILLSFASFACAQQTLWGQCGGIGWTGSTTCVSGACCQYSNDWYSQCLLCTTTGTSTTTVKATSTSSSTSIKATSTTLSTSTKTTSQSSSISTKTSSTSSVAPIATFTNPVLYEDFADNDIFRGPDNYFYYSASNMHYSPGAPILRSADLVNWEFIGHSVPSLGVFGDGYNMTGNQTAYDGGTWASTLRYRESNGLWYWIGCVNFWVTYTYTAPSVTGPWTQAAALYGTCYYDCGLLIDDDDTMYVVYGGTNVSIAQLSSDGLSQVATQQVFSSPSVEGNRLYKINGTYYVLDDHPGDTTFIWKSTNIWSGWEQYTMLYNMEAPISDGGLLSQGSLIETQTGDWYFMSFSWAYPAGRMPVLAPVTWSSDGWPVLTTVDGTWGEEYPYPLESVNTPSWTGTDSFSGNSLGVAWEWNHNPDETKYTVNNGLTLYTATVITDLYHARNTLTHRLHGPQPVATIAMDISNMADGDRTGLAAFRDFSAYIGIWRSGSTYTVVNVQDMTQDANNNWATISNGTVEASASVSKGKIWLRGNLDARANGTHLVSFSYSTDGSSFQSLGTTYTMNVDFEYFIGYRWGIFNFATAALGGSVFVSSFTQV